MKTRRERLLGHRAYYLANKAKWQQRYAAHKIEVLRRIKKWRAENRSAVLGHKRRYYETHRAECYAMTKRCHQRARDQKTVPYAREVLCRLSNGVLRAADIPDSLAKAYAAHLKLRMELRSCQ